MGQGKERWEQEEDFAQKDLVQNIWTSLLCFLSLTTDLHIHAACHSSDRKPSDLLHRQRGPQLERLPLLLSGFSSFHNQHCSVRTVLLYSR